MRRRKRVNGQASRCRKRFSQAVMARDKACIWADRPGHECDGVHSAHHIVRQQTLKRATLTKTEGRWALVHDPDNGIRVCDRAHHTLTTKIGEFGHLRPEDVPERTVRWCREHGFLSALEREVPGLVVFPSSMPVGFTD